MKLKDAKIKVRDILEKHPAARDNDGTLLAHFIFTHLTHMIETDKEGESLLRLTSLKNIPFETVRRSRQIVQAGGEFLPTSEKVRRARRIKEKEFKLEVIELSK